MNIAENLQQVLGELPAGVRLVAVSKFHPNAPDNGCSEKAGYRK